MASYVLRPITTASTDSTKGVKPASPAAVPRLVSHSRSPSDLAIRPSTLNPRKTAARRNCCDAVTRPILSAPTDRSARFDSVGGTEVDDAQLPLVRECRADKWVTANATG